MWNKPAILRTQTMAISLSLSLSLSLSHSLSLSLSVCVCDDYRLHCYMKRTIVWCMLAFVLAVVIMWYV